MSGKTTNDGLDIVRDHLIEEVAELGVGTGTNSPSQSDDQLEEELLRRDAEAVPDGVGEALFSIRLDATEDFDEDLTEVGLFGEDGTLLARVTHSEVDPDDDVEIEYQFRTKAVNP